MGRLHDSRTAAGITGDASNQTVGAVLDAYMQSSIQNIVAEVVGIELCIIRSMSEAPITCDLITPRNENNEASSVDYMPEQHVGKGFIEQVGVRNGGVYTVILSL